MISLISKVITYLYYCVLLSFLILDIYHCIDKYLQNQDVSQIDFREFNKDMDSRYPTLTMCFGGPFLTVEFKKYGKPEMNETAYVKYLKGELWHKNMASIPYDNVTLNINDHVNSILLFEETWEGVPYVSFRSALMKCFSVDIPTMNSFPLNDPVVKYLQINMNTTVFRNGIRPKGNPGPLNQDSFGIQLHYPGQRMRATIQTWRWNGNYTPKVCLLYTSPSPRDS